MTTALPVVPARVHCEKQQETVAVTAHNVHTHGRKHSFRGFSTHSLSNLTLAHTKPHTTGLPNAHTGALPKRSLFSSGSGSGHTTAGAAGTGALGGSSTVRCADKETNASRPPSLITDDSSLASISSRSPSPEPTQQAPTPTQQSSRLEAAFKRYAHSFNVQILHTQLLPVLARSGPAATKPVLVLQDADVAFLFKWWHHLLLLSPPHPTVFVCVWALASHPTLLKSAIWNAHYALTLSTLLAQDANVLPTGPFVRLLALGYLLHPPTHATLRARFTAKASPRRTSSLVVQEEVWCQRTRQVEVFSELLRQIYQQRPNYEDEGCVLSNRLEQIMTKLLAVRTATPNSRLLNCGRILGQAEGRLAVLVESSLQAVALCTRAFDPAAVFHLLDLLSLLRIKQVGFWTTVLERILDTENHILQIRVFAYLYEHWPLYAHYAPACTLLVSPSRWQHYFVHWSGIVRDHYMRLLCYRLAATHPQRVRMLLKRTFLTSLGEHCQLRDCLPGNPIPNKKFAFRPCASMQQQQQQQKWLATGATPLALFAQHDVNATTGGRSGSLSSQPGALPPSPPQQHASPPAQGSEMSAASFVKRKLGLFRGLWEDATPPSPPASSTVLTASRLQLEEEEEGEEAEEEEARSDMAVLGGLTRTTSTRSVSSQHPNRPSPTRSQQVPPQRYRFVAEFVGKQWSLTGDADAIRFLDGVMDLAQNGRLPTFIEQLAVSEAEEAMEEVTEDMAFALGEGRKRLWTRSLSEWSVLLDDQERFWRSQQMLPGHTTSTPSSNAVDGASPAALVVPRLEVEFPRWFCQKTTTLRGDGIEPQLKR